MGRKKKHQQQTHERAPSDEHGEQEQKQVENNVEAVQPDDDVTEPTQPSASSSSRSSEKANSSNKKYENVKGTDRPIDPNEKFIAAIDQGTSSSRVMLFDRKGRFVKSAHLEIESINQQDDWVEQRPEEILRSVQDCIDLIFTAPVAPQLHPSQVHAVGVTNQRETTVVWDRLSGRPFLNAIVWNDSRTKELANRWNDTEAADAKLSSKQKAELRQKTGLPISPYFSALKLLWMREKSPQKDEIERAIAEGRALFGTIDTWLIWNLTGGATPGANPLHVTDVTNASRTMLMNIETRQWDEEICKRFNVPMSILPEIRSNADDFGRVVGGAFDGIRIAGCIGDQQAATLGQLCLEPGQTKSTYGTGAFLLMNVGTNPVRSSHALLSTVCFQLGRDQPCYYALEGSVAMAGQSVQWLRDKLKMIKKAEDVDNLAQNIPPGGLYFVPAFSGMLAPYWRHDIRGLLCGLGRWDNDSAHYARAVLDAAAYQTRDVLDAMILERDSPSLTSLRVDGGMAASDVLMQFQADLIQRDVTRPLQLEATASGAAFCAGLATGYWRDTEDLVACITSERQDRVFRPMMQKDVVDELYAKWKKAVGLAMQWAEPTHRQVNGGPTGTATPPGLPEAQVVPLDRSPSLNNVHDTAHFHPASVLPAATSLHTPRSHVHNVATSTQTAALAATSASSSVSSHVYGHAAARSMLPRVMTHLASLSVGVVLGWSVVSMIARRRK